MANVVDDRAERLLLGLWVGPTLSGLTGNASWTTSWRCSRNRSHRTWVAAFRGASGFFS